MDNVVLQFTLSLRLEVFLGFGISITSKNVFIPKNVNSDPSVGKSTPEEAIFHYGRKQGYGKKVVLACAS